MHNTYSDALDALLRDHCQPATVRAIEQGADAAALWQALLESGFADCLLPESANGAGLPLSDLAPVLYVLGRHAMPLPLAQTLFARVLLNAHAWRYPPSPSRWRASTMTARQRLLPMAATPAGS